MDFPFYGNAWNASSHPRYAQSFRKSPVEVHPKVTTPTPPPQVVKPKVVSIPVQFVGSEQRRPDSSDSALRSVGSDRSRFGPSHSAVKIQKVFRGFLVRKSMKKIKAIREEVNDIERRVSNKETVYLLRNDSKERLKVNEMLMSLLLKLDSVRGVDSGVRDCRKSVIKKAIALQELVDAIVSGEQSHNGVTVAEIETTDQNQGINGSCDNCHQPPRQQTQDDEITNDAEFMPNFSESEVISENQETVESSQEMVDNQEESQTESQTDSSANPENVADEEEESKEEGANEACLPDEEEEETNNKYNSNKEDSVENKRSKELLMRMMEDNEKMLGLMAKLFERNQQQTRMLTTLSQRVEQLEKAFLSEKLRRKKRRSAADCVEKSPDLKKCGKR